MSSTAKKPRNIGNDFARKLEAAFEKPRGWMDVYHAGIGDYIEDEVIRPELAFPASQSDQMRTTRKNFHH